MKPNKGIDTRISTPLFNLPLGAIATGDQPQVLPQRNLLRGVTWSLPSGQAIAAEIGAPALTAADLVELKSARPLGGQRSRRKMSTIRSLPGVHLGAGELEPHHISIRHAGVDRRSMRLPRRRFESG